MLDRGRAAMIGLGLVAALVALIVATEVFPYRSLNHDEGVYLQQAELLLHGRVFLRPPVEDALRPWFFVEATRGLYSKYTPVPAAVFALGKVLGGYNLALAGIAAAVVVGTTALARELFDGRTGVFAGVFVLGSPLFLVQTGLFLPYALATALNIAFALAYLRAERRESLREAALAGTLVGVAFFSRPYTTVLFALPFVLHALTTFIRTGAWRVPFDRIATTRGVIMDGADTNKIDVDDPVSGLFVRRVITAALGAVGVLVALGYNTATTGDPFVFPYLAFAAEDGIGFGHRAILGHGVAYTLELGVRTNALVLEELFTEWVFAGALGAVAAAVGIVIVLVRGNGDDRHRHGLLATTFLTVAGGNVAFWGNYNILGAFDVETDGLIHYLGPYYHYDLLVPTAVFAAVATVTVGKWFRAAAARARLSFGRVDVGQTQAMAATTLLICVVIVGAAAAVVAADPIERNNEVTTELQAGYELFVPASGTNGVNDTDTTSGGLTNAVVFLPTPYGPWLNHPFQMLRNDADYGGSRVYALGDTHELAVADAFPERNLYRYVYAGSWSPTDDSSVRAELQRVERTSGERIRLNIVMDRPAGMERTTVRVTARGESTYLLPNRTTGPVSLSLVVENDRVAVAGSNLTQSDTNGSLALDGTGGVTIEMFVSTGMTSGYSYQVDFPVQTTDGWVQGLSPTVERCPVPTRCVPVEIDETPPNQSISVALSNATGSSKRNGAGLSAEIVSIAIA